MLSASLRASSKGFPSASRPAPLPSGWLGGALKVGIVGARVTWGACWRQPGWRARPRAPPWTRGRCPPRSLLSPRGPSPPCMLGEALPSTLGLVSPAARSEPHLPAFPTSSWLSAPTPRSCPKGPGWGPWGALAPLRSLLGGGSRAQGPPPVSALPCPAVAPRRSACMWAAVGQGGQAPLFRAAARAEKGRPATRLAPGSSLPPGLVPVAPAPLPRAAPHPSKHRRSRTGPQ